MKIPGRRLRWTLLLGVPLLGLVIFIASWYADDFGISQRTHLSQQEQALAVLKSFWDQSMALPGIDTGPAKSKKRLVIIFDANCPMCAYQWAALKP